VAATRKLSAILHAIWRDGSTFQFKAPAAPNETGKQSASIAADDLLAERRSGRFPQIMRNQPIVADRL
jgi:hypothetical protein